MSDNRTPEEQHIADRAAAALNLLNKIDDVLGGIERHFAALGRFMYDIDEDQGLELLGVASTIQLLRSEGMKNLVRDVASKLPVRGLDY
jgi:hypothetical protein